MIDFRYHLVSLVSVFLALAVGIVLGAGPLKGSIGTTLTTEVEHLRDDKAKLRSSLDDAQGAVRDRDTFLTGLAPQLVAGRLTGRNVAVVRLPGADTVPVHQLIETLQAAGATLVGQLRVTDAWAAPDRAAARAELWSGLRGGTTPGPASPSPSGSGPSGSGASGSGHPAIPSPTAAFVPGLSGVDAGLARMLAAAVTGADRNQPGGHDPGPRPVLTAMAKAGMVELDGDLTGPAGLVVVLAPAVADDDPDADTDARAAVLAHWAQLSIALDTAGSGTVVVGPASAASTGGLITALRALTTAGDRVTTVDCAGSPMGDVTTVYALAEQAAGGAGRYGFVGSVDAPMPSRAAAAAR